MELTSKWKEVIWIVNNILNLTFMMFYASQLTTLTEQWCSLKGLLLMIVLRMSRVCAESVPVAGKLPSKWNKPHV